MTLSWDINDLIADLDKVAQRIVTGPLDCDECCGMVRDIQSRLFTLRGRLLRPEPNTQPNEEKS